MSTLIESQKLHVKNALYTCNSGVRNTTNDSGYEVT